MELLYDLHTHTIMSGHAYSTLKENIEAAYLRGLRAYGFSEHTSGVPGSVNDIYFQNLKVIPRNYKGMKIFAGCEANIVDYNGKLDIAEFVCKKLDYIIASMHSICIEPCNIDQSMSAYFGAMENEYVKIIGHPDDSRFPIDYKELVKKAISTNTILELNNSSLKKSSSRRGGIENATLMLQECKKQSCPIVVNTDAHFYTAVGVFEEAKELLENLNFPKELILNTSLDNLNILINKDLDSEEFRTSF